ncbi:acyltransferase family protein [Gynuella sp.]|uniref:acyltransferase family protein n=1 Tax=Gynuella sp. TaxID=2969146 RepID=UPI003D1106FE
MKIDALTSLRFFAACAVLFSHLRFFGDSDSAFLRTLYSKVFWEGYIGVTFFFILSGFILSYSYQQRLHKDHGLKAFYVARVARIYPLHLLTLLLAIPWLTLIGEQPSALTYGMNALLLQGFSPDRHVHFSINLPAWSLSSEIFFYALFPLLILLKNRLLLGLWVLCLGWQGIMLSPLLNNESRHFWMYVFPVSRLMDFCTGMLLYRLYCRMVERIKPTQATLMQSGAVVLLALFFALKGKVPQTLRYDLYYLLPMALLILAFSFSTGTLSRWISGRVLIILGEVSFSLYLVHYLVAQYLQYLTDRYQLFHGTRGDLIHASLVLGISLLLSLGLYFYYETRMRRWVKQLFRV